MKILYLTDQIYLHGGVEKVLSQKANYLADVSGDDVVIVTHNQQGKQPVYQFSEKIEIIDLAIDYEIGKSYFHLNNLKKIPRHKAALARLLKTHQPDVVISCSIGPDFYFIPFIEKQIPKIKEYHATRHFNKAHSIKDKILKFLSDRTERQFHRFVLLNEDEIKYYQNRNHIVIPNPTEIDSKICELTSKRIIAAGRITFQKNFEDLIEICSNLFLEFPDWSLHIYGDDYLDRKSVLLKRIAELKMEHLIVFQGVTTDLKETFLDHSIYAMTSNHETFPMVLLEALSVGLPIVSYDCPTGPSRIITHREDGFIVPYNNSVIFAERLKQLMMDEDLRKNMGSHAKINAQRFEISKVMTQWKELFNQLTKYPKG